MKYAPFILLLSLLTACYISKPLEESVHVSLLPDLTVTITNSGNSSFTNQYNESDYKLKFLSGIKDELVSSNVIIDDINPAYVIHINELTVLETTKEKTVNDTTSEQHNKTYELTTLDISAHGTIRRVSDNKVEQWDASKVKSEKVTSSRNIVQMATGENKERNEYREKDFDSNEAGRFTEVCGRRSGVVIVKAIFKKFD